MAVDFGEVGFVNAALDFECAGRLVRNCDRGIGEDNECDEWSGHDWPPMRATVIAIAPDESRRTFDQRQFRGGRAWEPASPFASLGLRSLCRHTCRWRC